MKKNAATTTQTAAVAEQGANTAGEGHLDEECQQEGQESPPQEGRQARDQEGQQAHRQEGHQARQQKGPQSRRTATCRASLARSHRPRPPAPQGRRDHG